MLRWLHLAVDTNKIQQIIRKTLKMHLKTPYLEVSPPPGDDFESSSSFLEEEEDEEEGLPAAAAAAEEGEDAACAAAAAAAAAPLEAAMDRRCWRMPGFKPKKKRKSMLHLIFKVLFFLL